MLYAIFAKEDAMRTEFQSKDIQKMLGIPKQRVEYLSMKVPIRPEVDEVEGTGRAHLYSFKNAIQFATAQEASNLGLYIAEVRSLIKVIDSFSRGGLGEEHLRYFGELKGTSYRESLGAATYALESYFFPNQTDDIYMVLGEPWLLYTDPQDVIKTMRDSYGVVVLNLGSIKEKVIRYATG